MERNYLYYIRERQKPQPKEANKTTNNITRQGERIALRSPYSPNYPPRAKELGGRWDPLDRVWTFDARNEQLVRSLAREFWGTDGSDPTCTVRVDCSKAPYGAFEGRELELLGRIIISRPGRDERVRPGRGVVIESGGFATKGGSKRYPVIGKGDAVILIRDVPEPAAQALMADPKWGPAVELVPEEPQPEAAQASYDTDRYVSHPAPSLAGISDRILLAELRRRGYTIIKKEVNHD